MNHLARFINEYGTMLSEELHSKNIERNWYLWTSSNSNLNKTFDCQIKIEGQSDLRPTKSSIANIYSANATVD